MLSGKDILDINKKADNRLKGRELTELRLNLSDSEVSDCYKRQADSLLTLDFDRLKRVRWLILSTLIGGTFVSGLVGGLYYSKVYAVPVAPTALVGADLSRYTTGASIGSAVRLSGSELNLILESLGYCSSGGSATPTAVSSSISAETCFYVKMQGTALYALTIQRELDTITDITLNVTNLNDVSLPVLSDVNKLVSALSSVCFTEKELETLGSVPSFEKTVGLIQLGYKEACDTAGKFTIEVTARLV